MSRIDIAIEELRPDIVIMTEHKLRVNDIKFIKIAGYNIFSSFLRSILAGEKYKF